MLFTNTNPQVFMVLGSTDMRKAINGLANIVMSVFELNAFSGSYFVFCSASRKQIKILYYDHNGFCLWQKRLERDRFTWPESPEEVLEIDHRALRWMLDGLNPSILKGHAKVDFNSLF